MVAFPLASPASVPDPLAVMTRPSDECQPKSAVTSLTEPSAKVAVAFSWVVLPIATTGCDGLIATDSNAALAAPSGDSVAPPMAAASFPTGPLEELAVPSGRFTDPPAVYAAVIT